MLNFMSKFIRSKQRIPVGVIGATGMVGQKYVQLLSNHPWFQVVHVAASAQSAGKKYADAVEGRSQFSDVPPDVARLIVVDAQNVDAAAKQCRLVFSAVELGDKELVRALENKYAGAGLVVVSNTSAHRDTADVPVLIPEINSEHLVIIPAQQRHYGWTKGFIVTKPNCSLQSYLLPIVALERAGFPVEKVMVTTLQALSGAGYPGVSALDTIDNVVPYIPGEEEKTEREPLKILGKIVGGSIISSVSPIISAQCNRVPVLDGHLACVSVLFGARKPTRDQILDVWKNFSALPQELALPSAPNQPIIYRIEDNRPQPRKDRNAEKGMATIVGRLRPCPVFDFKFVGLSHNTVRGAAGGGILNAELLIAKGLV